MFREATREDNANVTAGEEEKGTGEGSSADKDGREAEESLKNDDEDDKKVEHAVRHEDAKSDGDAKLAGETDEETTQVGDKVSAGSEGEEGTTGSSHDDEDDTSGGRTEGDGGGTESGKVEEEGEGSTGSETQLAQPSVQETESQGEGLGEQPMEGSSSKDESSDVTSTAAKEEVKDKVVMKGRVEPILIEVPLQVQETQNSACAKIEVQYYELYCCKCRMGVILNVLIKEV